MGDDRSSAALALATRPHRFTLVPIDAPLPPANPEPMGRSHHRNRGEYLEIMTTFTSETADGIHVVLRPWRVDDEASLLRHANDPEVASKMRDTFPHPYT